VYNKQASLSLATTSEDMDEYDGFVVPDGEDSADEALIEVDELPFVTVECTAIADAKGGCPVRVVRPVGSGTYTYSSGSVYCGQFKKDKRDGIGKYTNFSKAWVFEGEWKDDKRNGKGKITWFDGKI
jgi:hypothetical protein